MKRASRQQSSREPPPSRLLNSRRAAAYLWITTDELHMLRCLGYIPIEQVTLRLAVYDVEELDRFAERHGRQRTYGESVLVYDGPDDVDEYRARVRALIERGVPR